jgi:N-acetylglucosaminyldiphosphoundecaprenol N-acetyl-beta-D-mannosaminyltransferase
MKQQKNIDNCSVPMIKLAGWPSVKLNRQEFTNLMLADCLTARMAERDSIPKLVFDINGHGLSLAQTDHSYNCALKGADYIHVDGQALVFASKLFSQAPLPERIATTDFFHDAALVSQERGLRIYLLGASEKMNAKAVKNVRNLYPNLRFSGNRHGYFSQDEEPAICQEIVDSRTDVLWVGLGKPKEQLFCMRNRDRLQGVGWVVTCGGLFDFLGGRNKRAPMWMQSAGLEWMHRMLQDPRRFFRRYLTTSIHAAYLLWSRRSCCIRSEKLQG